MKGTIMQLSSIGADTNFIISDSGITFFKTVFHRYTPFALQLKQYLFANKQFTLKNDGDLITRIYLQYDIPAISQILRGIDWPNVYYDYLIPGEHPYIDQPSASVWQTQGSDQGSSSSTQASLARMESALMQRSPLTGDILAVARGQTEQFQSEIAQISHQRQPTECFLSSMQQVMAFFQKVMQESIIDEVTGRMMPWLTNGVAAGLLGPESHQAFRRLADKLPTNTVQIPPTVIEERYHAFLVRTGVNPIRTNHICLSTKRSILDFIVGNMAIPEEVNESTQELRDVLSKDLIHTDDLAPIFQIGLKMHELKRSPNLHPDDLKQMADQIKSIPMFEDMEVPELIIPMNQATPPPAPPAPSKVETNYITSYAAVQSVLNDVFLEQAYYQYHSDTVGYILSIKFSNTTNFIALPTWQQKLVSLLPNNATTYDRIVIRTYFFFNRKDVLRKIPTLSSAVLDAFDKKYTWRFKLLFLDVMDFNTYREFVRTNKNYMTYLYSKKKTGNILWNWQRPGYVSPYPPLNPVEVKAYTPRINRILNRFNNNTAYQTYYQGLIDAANNQLDESFPPPDTSDRLVLIDSQNNAQTVSEGFYYTVGMQPTILSALKSCTVTLYSMVNCRGWVEGPIVLRTGQRYIPKRPVRSITVVNSGRTGSDYKGLPIVMDDPFIISNDITMNILPGQKVSIVRQNIPMVDLFFRFEKQRWMITNDFFTIAYNRDSSISYPVNGFQTSSNLFLSVYPDTDPWGFVPRLGHRLIKEVEFMIGDQVVQTINSYWFDMFESMFMQESKISGYRKMIGDVPVLTNIDNTDIPETRLIIPLPFWFSASNDSAFPMIALVNTECKLRFVFNPLESLILGWTPNLAFSSSVKTTLLVEYAYLDLDERIQFSTRKHQYLIRQTTMNSYHPFNPDGLVRFNLKNPVTDLFCMFVNPVIDAYSPITNIINSIKIIVNGAEMSLTSVKPEVYELGYTHERYVRYVPGIYAFPFALYPTQSQPSGSLNFSYVASASFSVATSLTGNLENYQAIILGRNYNVLYIMSGQASLLY